MPSLLNEGTCDAPTGETKDPSQVGSLAERHLPPKNSSSSQPSRRPSSKLLLNLQSCRSLSERQVSYSDTLTKGLGHLDENAQLKSIEAVKNRGLGSVAAAPAPIFKPGP
ncbi:unnamed protein product [Prunus armeniaca]|uniref:Uncharacterized protein n=1 Tax=Prunus armeniaca TaxID=36596 RepID=A0A6J5X4M9_PRUAR|nr:unnamed protein product [Prunus armeniaca]